MYVFDITYLLKASIKVAKKFRVIPSSVFYPPIRVLSPHPCFIPSSVFYPPSVIYPPIRVLSPHPCFIPSSVFYPLIRVLSPHPCFIPSSVFYPLIRVLSPHPCFIPPSVFYPLIRVLSPHPCFIPPSVFYPLIRVLSPHPCFIPSSVSVSGHPYPYPYPCFIPTRTKPISSPRKTRAQIKQVDWDKCVFCQVHTNERVSAVMTFGMSEQIQEIAKLDYKMCTRLAGASDLIAAEAKYHLSCFSASKRSKDKTTGELKDNDLALYGFRKR